MSNLSQQPIIINLKQKSDAEKYQLAQKLGTVKGFYQYYFDMLPVIQNQTKTFEAVNLLHYKIFGEEKYSSYDSFRQRMLHHLKKQK